MVLGCFSSRKTNLIMVQYSVFYISALLTHSDQNHTLFPSMAAFLDVIFVEGVTFNVKNFHYYHFLVIKWVSCNTSFSFQKRKKSECQIREIWKMRQNLIAILPGNVICYNMLCCFSFMAHCIFSIKLTQSTQHL